MYVHHPHCMNGSRTVVQVYLRCGAGPARRVAPLRPPPLGTAQAPENRPPHKAHASGQCLCWLSALHAAAPLLSPACTVRQPVQGARSRGGQLRAPGAGSPGRES